MKGCLVPDGKAPAFVNQGLLPRPTQNGNNMRVTWDKHRAAQEARPVEARPKLRGGIRTSPHGVQPMRRLLRSVSGLAATFFPPGEPASPILLTRKLSPAPSLWRGFCLGRALATKPQPRPLIGRPCWSLSERLVGTPRFWGLLTGKPPLRRCALKKAPPERG